MLVPLLRIAHRYLSGFLHPYSVEAPLYFWWKYCYHVYEIATADIQELIFIVANLSLRNSLN